MTRGAGLTWSIDHGQVGRGYAVPTGAGEDAVALARHHGVRLETTYTGKCAAALRADLQREAPSGPVLLWNTHASNDIARRVTPGWEARLEPRLRRLLAR